MTNDPHELRNQPFTNRVSRRTFVAGTAVAATALSQSGELLAQDMPMGTPEVTAESSVQLEDFRSVCERLCGADETVSLSEEALTQLLQRVDPSMGTDVPAGLSELLAVDGEFDREHLSFEANATATAILSFLYLGEADGAPLDNRSEIFAQLVPYRLLPYASLPAICKGAEYWTQEIDLPDRA